VRPRPKKTKRHSRRKDGSYTQHEGVQQERGGTGPKKKSVGSSVTPGSWLNGGNHKRRKETQSTDAQALKKKGGIEGGHPSNQKKKVDKAESLSRGLFPGIRLPDCEKKKNCEKQPSIRWRRGGGTRMSEEKTKIREKFLTWGQGLVPGPSSAERGEAGNVPSVVRGPGRGGGGCGTQFLPWVFLGLLDLPLGHGRNHKGV